MEFTVIPLYFTRFGHSKSYPGWSPVLDEEGATCDSSVDWKSSRDISMDLLFGKTDMAKELKMGSDVHVTSNFTSTSSKVGKLVIKTGNANSGVNVFEGLHKLQAILPANSFEFIASVKDFKSSDDKKGSRLDFIAKGLKLTKDEKDGSVRLEMPDLQFPENKWWKQWRDGKVSFLGYLSVHLRLDMAALTELYKRRFGRDPSTTQRATPTDMVILVGGNEDKEQGIKCHKSSLSEMSPVFAAMFQADMTEAKEGTLKIVDFSEACIRALVNFVYRRNVEEALKSNEMALELLKAADKYEMKGLKDILLQIFWYMPFTWFSVDVVIKLVCYTKNAGEDLAQAESKGWSVLKWYAKKYPEKLMESKEIENLCENPRAIKELVVQLLNNMK